MCGAAGFVLDGGMPFAPSNRVSLPTPKRRGPVWLFVLAASLAISLTGLAQQRSDSGASGEWETLEGCTLVSGATIDGDSFHVHHEDREYIFRLYFVDAPETDARLSRRMVDQAAYFGISSNDIARGGELATEFTRNELGAGEFTILTRWQNAMGRSSLARFYAIVFVHEENLAEQLVKNGLARIYGYRANWPGGPRSTTFINQLKHLELVARGENRGLWDAKKFTRVGDAENEDEIATNSKPPSTTLNPSLLDINSASDPELQKLPGIGKVLAGRIIAHRPFKTVEELDEVPGIGRKTMAKLRPLVRVELDDQ